ncbi:hypothetical protein SAMN05660706_1475 [Desulfoscipio geothermicus DSM 3669]|uniref:Uncharacterized protein n=1 Tax=Desulfoscipio geothermicus DSM 3669 TaxID=1121426 RepID=A0A1I6EI88_9FIRM|nr:hypothetical protein SAMN05660706_1475 [Desulfoscipio geothermicus DSM 3669]
MGRRSFFIFVIIILICLVHTFCQINDICREYLLKCNGLIGKIIAAIPGPLDNGPKMHLGDV